MLILGSIGAKHIVQLHVPLAHRLSCLVPKLPGVLDDILRVQIPGEREWDLPRPGRLDSYRQRLDLSNTPSLPVR